MKRTPFFSIHQKLGAKLVEFGGYEMPVQYSGIIDEHKTVRHAVGLFDVSHMGEFEVRGKDALALVQKVTTNDASKLAPGKVQYSAMCYPEGGIVDDLLVYRFEDHYMLVVNASNIAKDFEWIASQVGSLDAILVNKSDDVALLAVQGPRSLDTIQKLTKTDLSSLAYYTFTHATVAGIDMVVSRTGYTGELGYELYCEASLPAAAKLWNAITDAGKEFGLKPAGLGARDTLRLEMGFCLYGNDIDQSTNPLEAGLGWITKLDKGEFNGRNVLQRVKQEGVKRKLVGFVVEEERAFPRHGYEIRRDTKNLGYVTSGTVSPELEQGIGMGYVQSDSSVAETPICVNIRGKDVRAHIVKVPFIKK
ncbi:MAG TPA: glycine cleavage system aminomethyltransferase GcvT [Bacteroidota bacterium]|nr:glycine cleavage system aminomethyltransferase GcvT [Bacteroidota bacterium]